MRFSFVLVFTPGLNSVLLLLFPSFVPLPKSATPARIHSNTQLYDFELDEGDMEKLDGLDRGKDGSISWNPVDAE